MKLIFTFFFAFSLIFASNLEAKDEKPIWNTKYSDLMKTYAAKANPNMETLYCGCKFKMDGKKYLLDAASCGYEGNEDISVEHIVPAYVLLNKLDCYKEGFRDACSKDEAGKKRLNDIHNLMHSINTLNNHRNNYSFDIIKGEKREYSACDFEREKVKLAKGEKVQGEDRYVVEPREDVRGFIARTYLYMQKKYNLALKEREQVIMDAWNKLYPVEEWECVRNKNIAELQGDSNPFIDSAEICKNMK